ncbi:hypothetical protein SCLCIDRAFT_1217005 [Scleroderma citrinum Foug A]|uniref:Uncharacterized protein n=1 Tax=Scleroderma citrinum Foug A TaxID=1036808 RepID=A0A0C2ZES8_9AGAM|nr:hypothetical protein SCLCIDRAFT_1217005 [Scleroderma citrinum Foug A]
MSTHCGSSSFTAKLAKENPPIAHTIALKFKNVRGLGSCVCFARNRQAEHQREEATNNSKFECSTGQCQIH